MRCNRWWVAKPSQMATIAMLLIGGLWLTTETLSPQIAQAETRVDLSLERQPNETYDSLLRRAEAAASATAQESFSLDNQLPNVAITVVGQNEGAIAPILTLQVTRPEWRSYPDVSHWAKYYSSAKTLLLFQNVATSTPSPTGITPPNYSRRSFNGNPNQTGNSANNRGRTQIVPIQPNSLFTPGQFGNGNTGVTSIPGSITPTPGSGLTPLPPTSAPVLQPSSPQLPIPSTLR